MVLSLQVTVTHLSAGAHAISTDFGRQFREEVKKWHWGLKQR